LYSTLVAVNQSERQVHLATAMMHTAQTHSSGIATLMEQGHQMLRLAFWLTGDPAATIDAVAEALDGHDAADGFFETSMTVWARKLVIAKALGTLHSQMAASIHRTKMRSAGVPPQRDSLPPPAWTASHEVTSAYLNSALLAIDLFPRCTLLLLLFEKLSLDDVATLLNADKELVKEAEGIALTELARNIAVEQGWAPMIGSQFSAVAEQAVCEKKRMPHMVNRRHGRAMPAISKPQTTRRLLLYLNDM
jgi:DNA-directed RNA polymerase specialized sigma24 family protein